ALHLDVLAQRPGQLRPQRLERLAVVLGMDRRLVQQHRVRQRFLEHALGDLVQHRLGPALGGRLGPVDRELRRAEVVRDLGLGGEAQVAAARDLHRHLAGEALELVVAGDEVGLAADLDHRADAAAAVDVGRDQAFAGAAAGPLAGRRDALLAEELDRGVHVAGGLDQGVAAVHHPRLGRLAQLFDVRGGRLVVVHWAPSPAGCASGAAVSVGASAASAGTAAAAGAASAAGSAGASAAGSAAALSLPSVASPASPSPSSPFSETKSDTFTPRFRPSAIASASRRTISAEERMASSLPGMTKSASSGSQFVSTSPIPGMFRRLASRTASASFFMSMTTTASGSLRVSATPPRFASSFSSSDSVEARSFDGSRSSWPSVFWRRRLCRAEIRSWMVR